MPIKDYVHHVCNNNTTATESYKIDLNQIPSISDYQIFSINLGLQ